MKEPTTPTSNQHNTQTKSNDQQSTRRPTTQHDDQLPNTMTIQCFANQPRATNKQAGSTQQPLPPTNQERSTTRPPINTNTNTTNNNNQHKHKTNTNKHKTNRQPPTASNQPSLLPSLPPLCATLRHSQLPVGPHWISHCVCNATQIPPYEKMRYGITATVIQ